MGKRVEMVWPDELLKRVDEAREDVSRSAWIRRAVEHRLSMTFPDVPQVRIPAPPVRTNHDPDVQAAVDEAVAAIPKVVRGSQVPPPQFNRARRLG